MKANLLKAKMVEAGYTQRSLASEMNMSPTTLNLKLSGRRALDIREVEMLCDILGIHEPADKVNIFLS